MIDIVDLTKRFYFFIATTFSKHSVEVLPIDKIHLAKVQCSESKQGQNSRWFNGLIFIKIKIFFLHQNWSELQIAHPENEHN